MKNKEDSAKIYSDNNDRFENIQNLRSKSFSESNELDLKKNLLGGYDVKEVKEYINNLNFQHSRTINTYQERIDEFTTFVEMLNKEKEETMI